MHSQPEDFEKLKRLLSLKSHENPPPGYFDRLPNAISSRIRREQERKSWLHQAFDNLFAHRAGVGWALAGAVCLLFLLSLQISSNSPNTFIQSDKTVRPSLLELGNSTAASMVSRTNPVASFSINRANSTNPLPLDSLFDRHEALQTEPVLYQPPGR